MAAEKMSLVLLVAFQVAFNSPLAQAANNWDLKFNFTGYTKQTSDFLLKSCPKDVALATSQTVQMINGVLQGNALEIPTTNPKLPHVTCVNDTIMGPTVKFIIYTNDNDVTGHVDRQRMEMKANVGVKSLTAAKQGDSFVYSWWFQIDSQMTLDPQNRFFHIFQIKCVGVNVSDDPLVTFSLSNTRQFHMRLHYGNSSFTAVPLLNFTAMKGKWIQVFVEAVFKTSGSVRVIMKDQNGIILVPEKVYPHKMWWSGAQFFRPKWGLYRMLSTGFQPSDWQLFQNNQIWKK